MIKQNNNTKTPKLYEQWHDLIENIVKKSEKEQTIEDLENYDNNFDIILLNNEEDKQTYEETGTLKYPLLFARRTYTSSHTVYKENVLISPDVNFDAELCKIFDNTFDEIHISGTYKFDKYDKNCDRNQQDYFIFKPNGLDFPVEMKATDSFLIDNKRTIIMCHFFEDAKGLENTFYGIPVVIQLSYGQSGQTLFNADGSPRILALSNLYKDQAICGIKLSKIPQQLMDNKYFAYKSLGQQPDIILTSKDEFEFFAKEGSKCGDEEINCNKPIHYKKVAENKINLSFTNKSGKKCEFVVDEKGRTNKEFKKQLENDFNIKLDENFNTRLDKDKNVEKFERYYIKSKSVEDNIDGFNIDKSKNVDYIINYNNNNKSITKIYRLDEKEFPFEHDKGKEIIYTKQPNGENFINYYCNGEPKMENYITYEEKFNNYYDKADRRTKELLERGMINCSDGLMIRFDRQSGDIWVEKNDKVIKKPENKNNKDLTTINDKKIWNIYK